MTDILKQAGFASAQEVKTTVETLKQRGFRIETEASVVPTRPIKVQPENIRKIVRALSMHRKGRTHRVISSKLNVPISTVGKWIREGT